MVVVASAVSSAIDLAQLDAGSATAELRLAQQAERAAAVDSRFVPKDTRFELGHPNPAPTLIKNNFDSALALALAQGRPILVCKGTSGNLDSRYFEQITLRDTLIAALREKAVFLSLDMSSPQASHNTPNYFFESFPIYYLYDPQRKSLCGLIYSCPEPIQIARLLEQNCPLIDDAGVRRGGGFDAVVLENLVSAQQLLAVEDYKWAAQYLEQLQGILRPNWPRYGEVLLTEAFVLYGQGQDSELLDFARKHKAQLQYGSESLNLARLIAHSARRLAPSDTNMAASARSMVIELSSALLESKSQQSLPVLAGALELKAQMQEAEGDSAAAQMLRAERQAIIESIIAPADSTHIDR